MAPLSGPVANKLDKWSTGRGGEHRGSVSVRHFEFHAISCGPNVAVRFVRNGASLEPDRPSGVECRGSLSSDSASHQ